MNPEQIVVLLLAGVCIVLVFCLCGFLGFFDWLNNLLFRIKCSMRERNIQVPEWATAIKQNYRREIEAEKEMEITYLKNIICELKEENKYLEGKIDTWEKMLDNDYFKRSKK